MVLQTLVLLNVISTDMRNLSLGIQSLGLAVSSLGGKHITNKIIDSIHKNLLDVKNTIHEIATKSDKTSI